MDRRTQMSPESAEASDIFDKYCTANTLKGILGHYRQLCRVLRIKATHFPDFYPRLRTKLSSWRAQGLWAKFDKRASHKCYARGKACVSNRVLIIGGGPCGLRAAIEAQLLGAKVVLIEKRDRFSRNNVLHIWPFVIADLKGLGAKKFYGKFCAGSIDHISIRQLQCLLLKVALLLGVEIHEGVGFEGLFEPTENEGWRAVTSPPDHPVSQYTFDCLIGADGRRNTLEGFRRKALRAKLAIAITANFINKRSEAEARVKEISGVSYIFNQKFFQDLNEATGIDLENIVYYKDETHYFVMTAKKQSLLAKGVLLHDHADTAKLLSHENISTENLMIYAVEAAIFSTENQLPNLEFAVNHYGQPDVAMFDFTAMYAAESACRVIQRKGHKLMMTLVGDSLLEPFWPTGSGCARGFLSSFDACWMLRSWASGTKSVLDVVAERESIYRLLGQTTPENLNKEHMGYTIDPHSRYPNLNLRAVMPFQVKNLYDTDEAIPDVVDGALEQQQAGLERISKKRRRDSVIAVDSLLSWLRSQVSCYGLEVEDIGDAFARGDVLCAIIHRFRPDLIEFPSTSEENVDPLEIAACRNQVAFDFLHKEYSIAPVMSGLDSVQCGSSEFLGMVAYLSQIYESFKGEIPQIKYPRVEGVDDFEESPHRPSHVNYTKHVRTPAVVVKHGAAAKDRRRTRLSSSGGSRGVDADTSETSRRHRKRRSDERSRISVEEREKRREEIERNRMERMKRRVQERILQTERFIKSMRLLQTNDRSGEISTEDLLDCPFDDYTFHLYRQTAPDFEDRCKRLEHKLFYSGKEIKSTVGGSDAEKQHVPGLARDLEEKLKGSKHVDKKPKDLIRAIGKIEKSDWNVQLIEKKIAENKTHGQGKKERDDKVPKWSREAFDDKRDAMKRKMEGSPGEKAANNDKTQLFEDTVKKLGCKLKDGNALDVGQRGCNKVSQMAEQLVHKMERPAKEPEAALHRAAVSRPVFEFPKKGGSETCHFCKQRVYVVERMTAEGKFFHRNCFRCEYCNTSLRLGNYAFDREGRYGERFYCSPHYTTIKVYGWKKYDALEGVADHQTPDRKYSGEGRHLLTPTAQQLLSEMDERGTTPERVEFENTVDFASEEELLSEMDEDEWTDRNFGTSNADNNTSDEASELSDDEDEVTPEGIKEDIVAVAKDPLGAEGEAGSKDKGTESSDSDTEVASGDGEGSYEDGSLDDEEELEEDEDGDEEEDDEEGDEEDDEEEECGGSTTEIETDSEFAEDPPQTVPGSIPRIIVDEPEQLITRFFETVPANAQVPSNSNQPRKEREPPVASKVNAPILSRGPFHKQHQEYEALRMVEPTKSTVPLGRAYPRVYAIPKKWEPLQPQERLPQDALTSKMSMELKKKYLYGAAPVVGITTRKSTDPATQNQLVTSVLDMISEKQKLLQPASKPSPAMQAYLDGEEKLKNMGSAAPRATIGNPPSFGSRFGPPLSSLVLCTTQPQLEKEISNNYSGISPSRDDTISMNRLNIEKTMEAERTSDCGSAESITLEDSEKGDTEKDIDSAVSPRSIEMPNGEILKEVPGIDGPPPQSPQLLSETPSSCSQSKTESQCTIVGAPTLETDEMEEESETESCGCSVGELTGSDLGDDNFMDEVDGEGSPGHRGEPPRVEIEDEFGVTLALDVEESVKPSKTKSVKQASVKKVEVDKVSNNYCMSSSDSRDSLTSGLFLETEMSEWMGEAGAPQPKKKNGRKKHAAGTKALLKKELKEADIRNKSLGLDLDNMDFMDIDGMSSPDELIESISRKQGYSKLVDEELQPAGSLDSGKTTDFECSSVPESSSQCSTPVQGSESGLEELEHVPVFAQSSLKSTAPGDRKVTEAVNPAIALLQQASRLANEKIVVLDRVGPFSNARDSLDYRKMKGVTSPTKSKDLFSTYALPAEAVAEKPSIYSAFDATKSVLPQTNPEKAAAELSPTLEATETGDLANKSSTSPNTMRRIEEINKERTLQNDLIRTMVLARIRKSPEKNRRGSRGSLSPFGEASSSSTSVSETSERVVKPEVSDSQRGSLNSVLSHDSEPEETPEAGFRDGRPASPEQPSSASSESAFAAQDPASPTSKSHYEPLYTSPPRFRSRPKFDSPLSIYQSVTNPPTPVNPTASLFTPLTPGSESSAMGNDGQKDTSPSFYRSMPDLSAILTLGTPTSKTKVNKVSSFATPSVKKWEDYKHATTVDREKARQAARERARLKSDEELGMSPTDNYGMLKDKLRRKLSVPEDDVFDPNAAITVTSHSHSEPTSASSPVSDREYSVSARERAKTRPISDLFDSTTVASSIRHNVDFPIKKNPFLASCGSEERHPHYKKAFTPETTRVKEHLLRDEDDFVQVQLRMNPSNETPERRKSPEKSKSVGWDASGSPPGNFPYYFTPSSPPSVQPQSVSSVRTVDPNWVLERPDSMNMPVSRQRSNTFSDIFQTPETQAPSGAPSKSPAEKKPKKSKDRDRRRSLIQAVSDFFTSRTGSSGGGSASGSLNSSMTEQDKTSSTSSSSPALPGSNSKDKFSLFRLTPKLLQKDKKSPGSTSKSREFLANLPSSPKPEIPKVTPPAKSPRSSFMSYLSQPELVIQRLSASPTPFKSSRTNISGGPGIERAVSLENDKYLQEIPPTPLSHYPGHRVTRPKNEYVRPEGRRRREIQEIQLQLESIETEQRQLESRGVAIEKKLRGEEPDEENREDAELMEEWFTLVREKTRLARFERELIVRGQELELDDRHERVGEELDKSLLVHDQNKSPEIQAREIELFRELKTIEDQRGSLLSHFHEDMQKYESEDQDLEDRIKSSSISPRESNV